MLELNFEPPEEIKLPDGRIGLIVGLKLKDIVKGVNLNALQREITQLQKQTKKTEPVSNEGKDKQGKRTRKEIKDEKQDSKLIDKLGTELTDLMEEIINLGIIDKETRENIIFPREYRNPYNDRLLVEAIMKATERGAPPSDPLSRKAESKSSEK